jgi:hypothetical protein
MTSTSSKAIPFIVLAIVAVTFIAEAVYDIDIDLESMVPILAPLGVAGAAKTAIENAGAVRKALPENIRKIIQDEAKKGIDSVKSPVAG